MASFGDPSAVRPVLVALAAGDTPTALRLASGLAGDPDAPRLAGALARHLAGTARGHVYESPAGFRAFIEHGSNPELYRRAIEHLAALHRRAQPASVLDIGCGDGRVTATVLDDDRFAAGVTVDLVEPSEELLVEATRALDRRDLEVRAHHTTIEAFLAGPGSGGSWDLAQSTFALHNLSPGDRADVLAELAGRVGRLVVVEFDVPQLEPHSAAHLDHLAERYEAGIAEYVDHTEAIEGFLLPVLVGQLDPLRQRHTFEQPIDRWVAELSEAGFREVVAEPVAPYWWAPALAVVANGAQL